MVGFDFTNSFGYTLKLLVNASKILAIEPNYSNGLLTHLFISNKTRYFFNGLLHFNNTISLNFILQLIKALSIVLYMFNLNILKTGSVSFFYVHYGNISTDLLCLLSLFRQKYYFIKLKNVLVKQLNNTLESDFLVNSIKLNKSNLCLLVNINIKLEATSLSLTLKQRGLKGNFRLISICSYFNITTSSKVIGTSLKVLLLIGKGLHPLCQVLKHEKNPCLLLNSQLLELNSCKFINVLLLYLNKYFKYYKLNTVNISIYEPSIYLINNVPSDSKMLLSFSSIYLLNLLNIHHHFIINVLNLNILYLKVKFYLPRIHKLCLIQYNLPFKENYHYNNYMKYMSYFSLATKTYYQDSAFFFNTQGLLKKTIKLFNDYTTISSWKIVRSILSYLKTKFTVGYYELINYGLKLRSTFLKFMYLLILAKKPTSSVNIVNNINPFLINNSQFTYHLKVKLITLKLKFWISDFYIGDRDGFTNSSVTMLKYSKTTRLQLTNFF